MSANIMKLMFYSLVIIQTSDALSNQECARIYIRYTPSVPYLQWFSSNLSSSNHKNHGTDGVVNKR
jgi:hypothetical protein